MALGVTTSNSKGDSFAFNPGQFAYIAQSGNKYSYNGCLGVTSPTVSYGLSYGLGDVIKIEFNTNNKTITFYKNNVSTEGCFHLSNSLIFKSKSYVS